MDVTLQQVVASYSPQLRAALASILRLSQDLTPEQQNFLIRLLEGDTCTHPDATRTCNVCDRPASTTCCHSRDPAIRVQCPTCGLDTLA
jgi:hypothetical protein